MTVVRDGPIDPDGPCANTRPEDDFKHVTLSAGKSFWLKTPKEFCNLPELNFMFLIFCSCR